jgi:hypothetical protein
MCCSLTLNVVVPSVSARVLAGHIALNFSQNLKMPRLFFMNANAFSIYRRVQHPAFFLVLCSALPFQIPSTFNVVVPDEGPSLV